jgi:uncharacterized cupredoxin-like copper-binding protein
MYKLAQLTLVGILGATLAACGGGASSSPSAAPKGATTSAGGAVAKTSVSASAAAGAAIPSAAVVGQKAPGPYAANGAATVANGTASIEGTDTLKWQPDTIIAKAGDKITLQVKNAGNTAHTFISPSLGVNSVEDVPIGKTTPLSFTAPTAPGAYQFWCNIPGHAEAGMVGEVIVQ